MTKTLCHCIDGIIVKKKIIVLFAADPLEPSQGPLGVKNKQKNNYYYIFVVSLHDSHWKFSLLIKSSSKTVSFGFWPSGKKT